MNLSEPVLAAAIGACATLVAAFLNLRMSWRKELRDRERGQPITKKNRRGPIGTVFVLMLASAIGGFALSWYLFNSGENETRQLQAQMQTKLSELSATAARLENARLDERGKLEAEARRIESIRMGEEGVAAAASIGPCKARNGAPRGACGEAEAVTVAVCAPVPLAAKVTDVNLFARFEDSQQLWSESQAAPGQDVGQARFQDKQFELPDTATTKQVCFRFAHWDSKRSRVARIVVKYSL